MNSLDVNNRSCCVLQDVCECWQACSCTNVMCRAACIASVLHECFSECYNLSVEICSYLTSSFVGSWLSISGRITHNMLCCGVTRTKFMDSLYFVLLLIWVLQIVIACAASGRTTWLSIGPFPEKRLMLVRWLLPSLWNGCHVCFPWSSLKVHLSEHHIWRFKHWMFFLFWHKI